MNASVLQFAMVSGLLCIGAIAADHALGVLGMPRRMSWLFALALNVLLALAPPAFHSPFAVASGAIVAAVVPNELNFSAAARLWMLSSVLCAAWLLVSAIRLNRCVARLPKSRMGGVTLRVSKNLGPAVAGLPNPAVVVPLWFPRLPLRTRRFVLRHELSHIRAGDPWLVGLGLMCVVALAWNPLQWLLLVRLRRAAELDCDARLLSGGHATVDYGNALLEVASFRPTAFGPGVAACATTSFMERRIQTMISRNHSRSLAWTSFISVLAAAAFGTAVVASGSGPNANEEAAKRAAETAEVRSNLEASKVQATKHTAEEAEAAKLASKHEAEAKEAVEAAIKAAAETEAAAHH